MTYLVQTFETGFIPAKYENMQGRTVWEITAAKEGLHLFWITSKNVQRKPWNVATTMLYSREIYFLIQRRREKKNSGHQW